MSGVFEALVATAVGLFVGYSCDCGLQYVSKESSQDA